MSHHGEKADNRGAGRPNTGPDSQHDNHLDKQSVEQPKMTTKFHTVSSTCDWDTKPNYYRLDPELYRPLVVKSLAAFIAMPDASSILVSNQPDSDNECFGSTDFDDGKAELLGEVVPPGTGESPQKVFAFDLGDDCEISWDFRDLEIIRPFAHHQTKIPVCGLRLTWESKYTSDQMHVDFQIELPEAAELTGEKA